MAPDPAERPAPEASDEAEPSRTEHDRRARARRVRHFRRPHRRRRAVAGRVPVHRVDDRGVPGQHRAADDAQAKAAAASGLHYAAAVLADRETFDGELDGNPFDNPTIFEQFEVATSGTGGKRAFFSIRSVALADGGGYEQRFGATDEGGKLNINSMIQLDQTGEALYNALMKLPNMSPDVADAIVDWVDADEVKRPAGAENGEYGSLPSPYKAKNGPLNSLDELLLVQGVTPEMLYGGDTNRNGVFDDGEPGTDRGWSDYLTVYGRELNVDRDGTVRTYLNIPDLTVLGQQLTNSVGEELATYILACRLFRVTKTDESGNVPGATTTASFTTGSNGSVALNLSSTTTARPTRAATLDELKAAVEAKKAATLVSLPGRLQSQMDFAYSRIALPRPPDAPQDVPDVVAYSPLLDATKRAALFALLLDKTTIKQAVELVPRINVNTAPREVLMGLTAITNAANEPLMTEADVDAILAERQPGARRPRDHVLRVADHGREHPAGHVPADGEVRHRQYDGVPRAVDRLPGQRRPGGPHGGRDRHQPGRAAVPPRPRPDRPGEPPRVRAAEGDRPVTSCCRTGLWPVTI